MDRQLLTEEDWESLYNLAFHGSVLQLGYDDGQDTVKLARVAHHLTVIGTPQGAVGTDEELRLASLRNAVWSAGVYRHLTLCRAPWMESLGIFAPQQFDVAVVNPSALGWELLDTLVSPVLNAATHMALIESPGWNSWQAVSRICPEPYFSVTKSGPLIVAKRVFGSEANPLEGD